MSNNDSRVLTRRGARELTEEEVNRVTGRELTIPAFRSFILTHPPGGGLDSHFD